MGAEPTSMVMRGDPSHLAAFLLRQVRVGVIATAMVVAALGVAYFVLDHDEAGSAGLALVLGSASVGAVVIALLPWRRLLETPHAMAYLYVWSAADILLISFAVAATGGARSDLFMLYALTTFFFVASYPPIAQILLLIFTGASYAAVLAVSSWELTAGAFTARLSVLGILAYLGGHLSSELMERAIAETTARNEATQRATLLSMVAQAGRDMSLDPSQVVDVAAEAVTRLGFSRASFVALREDGTVSHVVTSRGSMDSTLALDPADAAAIERVVREGGTKVNPGAPPGGEVVAATPVWVGGWMAAVLVGAMPGIDQVARHEVEAFELLATNAGFALDNASRYEEQRRAVERLEETDRLKSDFVTTVSHELRTPLTSILGNAATLQATWESLDEETRLDLLSRLTTNARALEAKITDLLDFSSAEPDGLAGHPFGEIDLTALLTSAAERLGSVLSRHAFRAEVPPGLVTGGDAGLLAKVVENLLMNAATHTPPGTAVLLSAQPDGDPT